MSESSGVIFRDSKVFWKVRSSVDVVIIKHSANDVLEVVCTDPVRNRECGRLYVNESVLRDRVAEKLFLAEQKEHLSKKDANHDSAKISSASVEISIAETANFILDRLHVESYDPKSRIFHIEMLEYLPTEEKIYMDMDGPTLICSKPASLVPFDTGTPPVSENTSQEGLSANVITKPAAIIVETTPPPIVASPKSPKSPKANVPRIELEQITQQNSQDTQISSTTPPPHKGPKNNYDAPKSKQQSHQSPHNAAHLQVHTADLLEADFHVYHGRRDQNHRPFTPSSGMLNTMSNSNPSTARGNNTAHTPIASPGISPRNAPANAPTFAFTPRKGKKNHVSVLQTIHNSQNVQAAEQRHAKQQVQAHQSNLSHSVGSNHLAPIPLPDQLTKVTTHPTLPPNRNLTPHQEPYNPEPKPKHKKKSPKTVRARLQEMSASLGRLFGIRDRDRKVHSSGSSSVHQDHERVVPVLNAHNEVLLLKPSEAKRHGNTGSAENTGAATYGSSIPKHMQTNGH
eukprot:gene8995-10617_t